MDLTNPKQMSEAIDNKELMQFAKDWHNKKYCKSGSKEIGDWTTREVFEFTQDFHESQKAKMPSDDEKRKLLIDFIKWYIHIDTQNYATTHIEDVNNYLKKQTLKRG